MFCKNCGKELKDGTAFCPECGTKIVCSNGENINIENISTEKSNAFADKSKNMASSEQYKTVNDEKSFSFKIFPRGRSYIFKTIQSFRGAYKVNFTVEENRLLVVRSDNYGETVYSAPYYLIRRFELSESISALAFLYLLFAVIAILLIATVDYAGKGIMLLAFICVFICLYGFKENVFVLLLNDGQRVKIRLMKISKKKKIERNDFINMVNYKINNAVNTGAVFESAGTELTIGDIRNRISIEEKKRLMDSIKNRH